MGSERSDQVCQTALFQNHMHKHRVQTKVFFISYFTLHVVNGSTALFQYSQSLVCIDLFFFLGLITVEQQKWILLFIILQNVLNLTVLLVRKCQEKDIHVQSPRCSEYFQFITTYNCVFALMIYLKLQQLNQSSCDGTPKKGLDLETAIWSL